MLVALSIRNLAVIEAVQLQFHRGFHVLTGETGAGKSIIMDALSLISGIRGSSDFVRYGCDRAEVEASFELAPDHPVWEALAHLGIYGSSEEFLIIRRELTAKGKSVCRINGQMINLTMLREIGELLIHIHGQHEHQSLLKVDRHLAWLDAYGGEEMMSLKQKYRDDYNRFMSLQQEWNQLKELSQQSYQMLDLYRFQIEELRNAQLQMGEDELLAEEKCKLANAEQLMDNVNRAYNCLYHQGAMDSISVAISKVEEVCMYDTIKLQPLLEQMRNAYYQLEDATYQLRNYAEMMECNPERLTYVEERLNQLTSLKRKYGATMEDMLKYLDKIEVDAHKLRHKDEQIEKLEAETQQQLSKLVQRAQALSDGRRKWAVELTKRIGMELQHLHMGQTRLDIRLNRLQNGQSYEVDHVPVRFTSKNGWDEAEFLISTNPGEPLRSLHKIASGGELSRMMLAIKTIFAEVDRIPVLIFDEVDTGVSGRAAQAIANKLVEVSRSGQVFAITHLPQIACMADHHYYIEKQIHDERTFTQVVQLEKVGRVAELARMLSGVEVTERTMHHAQEMLKLAEHQKGA